MLVVRDQARLRCLVAVVAGAAACFRFRPPATGNNKVAWRRSGAVLFAFREAPSVRFEAGVSCARLRFGAAIKFRKARVDPGDLFVRGQILR